MSNMLGVDPEFYIRNKRTGKALSAHRLLGDRKIDNKKYEPKAHPGKVTSELDRDGAALEVRNTFVTNCRDYLVPYIAQSMQYAHNELVEKYKDKFEFNCGPVFSLSDLRGPADIREFGCRPDINAYTLGEQNPVLPKGERRRFTGGHIHISGAFRTNTSVQEASAAAALMDATIGLPMVAILGERFSAGEAERREYYGKAGSFRFDGAKRKLEYRTLSGRLLLHPIIMTWALGVAKALNPPSFNVYPTNSFGSYVDIMQALSAVVDVEEIARTINEHDVAAAEALYKGIYETLNVNHLKSLKNKTRPDYGYDLSYARSVSNGYALIPFEPFIDLMIEANHNGVYFEDDMLYNWQLYKDKQIRDHYYVGYHNAMKGYYDDLVFPQRPFLKNHSTSTTYKQPVEAHYLGDSKAAKKAATANRGW